MGKTKPVNFYPLETDVTFNFIVYLAITQYQLALHQIDLLRKDGKFVGVDGSIPEGQGIVMAHLNECHELLEMVRRFYPYLATNLPIFIL